MLTPNQEAWLKALESGEFNQTNGLLDDGNGCYCCLGVAAKVSGLCEEYGKIPGASLTGHPKVMDWLRLREGYGSPNKYDHVKGVVSLTSLNDSHHLSFKEIAQIIRANPEAYFVPPEPNPGSPT
jgi:hypothetical protein